MEKRFDFVTGELKVEKAVSKGKPALKVTLDSTVVEFGYEYEGARDRAFEGFEQRNANAVYTGLMNMGEWL